MENICEFCMALRPIVYCKSDAARLCLFCDAKVHSANALSSRHPRTLVCEACRRRPVYVRCFDHEMFMCRSCDNSHHASSQHQKKVVRSYVGCPSALDFAALWGFDLNESENKSIFKDHYVFASVTADSESEEGSCSQQTEVVKDDNCQKNTCMSIILQQILDLKRLQLSEGSDNSCLVRGKGKADQSSVKGDAVSKVQMEHSLDQHYKIQYMGSPQEEMPEESFLSQLGHLISTENSLQGDTFWQCKSPAFSNELWPQNMQDIGVCDELQCFDDLRIPDVDLTFQKHSSFSKPESFLARTMEDISGATSACIVQSADANKVFNSSDQVLHFQTINEYPHPIQPSYSTSSFSVSRITVESSTEYKDDGLFPKVNEQLLLGNSSTPENAKLDGKENVIMKSKGKAARWYEKRVRYSSQKAKSDGKKRGKGKFLRAQAYESESVSVTRSF
ncbi:unnamed protein product [Fraxinus pennsylvanica]|uniref:B box-type domain-containing protein n=1 Tax=Fraxinus pennsylvanica TaxID=56036 RepID=A0AAD2DIP3_9LAMI|nr:unnamed protein product [Fraxinus pennsylvanica]